MLACSVCYSMWSSHGGWELHGLTVVTVTVTVMQVAWLCWQYTLAWEARITLGHMPVPEYKSFLVNLKVRSRVRIKHDEAIA